MSGVVGTGSYEAAARFAVSLDLDLSTGTGVDVTRLRTCDLDEIRPYTAAPVAWAAEPSTAYPDHFFGISGLGLSGHTTPFVPLRSAN